MFHIVEFYNGVYYDTGEAYADKKEAEKRVYHIAEEMEANERFEYAVVLDDDGYKYFLENGVCP